VVARAVEAAKANEATIVRISFVIEVILVLSLFFPSRKKPGGDFCPRPVKNHQTAFPFGG
jgi:hypothetical protein